MFHKENENRKKYKNSIKVNCSLDREKLIAHLCETTTAAAAATTTPTITTTATTAATTTTTT
jgi:hypothetical protein